MNIRYPIYEGVYRILTVHRFVNQENRVLENGLAKAVDSEP